MSSLTYMRLIILQELVKIEKGTNARKTNPQETYKNEKMANNKEHATLRVNLAEDLAKYTS